MQIYIQVKQLGKRRPSVAPQIFTLSDNISTVRDLLQDIVTRQVNQFNQRSSSDIDEANPHLLNYLSSEQIQHQSSSGKITFNLDYRQQHQDINSAIENVFLAFTDGLFRIFLNDNELSKLDDTITLHKDDQLTFIRLVMLAGRIW